METVQTGAVSDQVAEMASRVELAHIRLEGWRKKRPDALFWTPLLRSRTWLERPAEHKPNRGPVYIKLDSEQATGSFKVRGALNCIGEAVESARKGTKLNIVAASTGNHAMAIAHSVTLLRDTGEASAIDSACIFLPNGAQESKISTLRKFEPTVELKFTPGNDCLDAELAAGKHASILKGGIYVSPCNDPEVIAGQGTIGVEVLEDLHRISGAANQEGTLYITVGGGGLISGIGSYVKTRAPKWRIVGAQPEASAVMQESIKAGRILDMPSSPTLSDGSAGGLEKGKLVKQSSTGKSALRTDAGGCEDACFRKHADMRPRVALE